MYEIISDPINGIITISDSFSLTGGTGSATEAPYFYLPNDEYILSFTNLSNVKEFTKFIYESTEVTEQKYLTTFYRISRDTYAWTEWLELESTITNFPVVDTKELLYIDLKWVREGMSEIGVIRLLSYELEGDIERDESELDNYETITIENGTTKIISNPFIFKVFRIDDIEIISSTGIEGLIINYRYSQDSKKTWSQWEPFTVENVTTTRITPIRFFQIEYSIENNTGADVKIQDINLLGDFQNVSEDGEKTNLFGIKECCQTYKNTFIDENGNVTVNTNFDNSSGACATGTSNLPTMTSAEKAQLWNPYSQNTALNLLEKLSYDATQLFGHKVMYFATDADRNGQDHTLNEYQLYNVVCEGDLKVAIEGNNFPDSQIKMNIFDLDLFETMEAHISKKEFKEVFGIQRRPAKEDFMYFCDVNRMYQIDHAQQFRSFNNAAVYYKVILKKYSKKANIIAEEGPVKNRLDMLTKNTTINELFGVEQELDKKAIANKDQTTTLTNEPIRVEYLAEIEKELIENSSIIIAKAHYDMSSINIGTVGVKYKNLNPILKVSDNLALQVWFRINNYIKDDTYYFMDAYDTTNSLGWKSELKNDTITITLNTDSYAFNLATYTGGDPTSLNEDVWYCYVLNINQRQREIEQFIYKRYVDYEEDASKLSSTILQKVYYGITQSTPIEYELTEVNPTIFGSDMHVTNIRLFNDIIPEDAHNKILNQYILGDDAKYLIFADNATTRIYLHRFPYNEGNNN